MFYKIDQKGFPLQFGRWVFSQRKFFKKHFSFWIFVNVVESPWTLWKIFSFCEFFPHFSGTFWRKKTFLTCRIASTGGRVSRAAKRKLKWPTISKPLSRLTISTLRNSWHCFHEDFFHIPRPDRPDKWNWCVWSNHWLIDCLVRQCGTGLFDPTIDWLIVWSDYVELVCVIQPLIDWLFDRTMWNWCVWSKHWLIDWLIGLCCGRALFLLMVHVFDRFKSNG